VTSSANKPDSSGSIAWAVVLLPLLVATSFLLAQKWWIGGVAMMIVLSVMVSWLVSRYSLQVYFLMLLALLLPFSIETSLSDNLSINSPSEPMLAIAVFSIGWDVLRTPGHLGKLLGEESRWMIPLLWSFIISTCLSSIVWVSVKFSIVNITYIMVFFVWQKYYCKTNPNLFPKLWGLYSLSTLVVVGVAIYQFYQYQWNPQTIRGIFRPFYKDNTIFGASAALLASFWIFNAATRRWRSYHLTFAILTAILTGAVVLSDSRAAILSIGVAFLVWSLLRIGTRIWHLAVVVAAAVVLTIVFHESIYEKLLANKNISHSTYTTYVEQMESSGNISSDVSNLERLNRWTSGIGMFAEKPWVGFGPGTFQFAYIPYQKPEYVNRLTVTDAWHIPENSGGTAHSEYILALSEMGISGIFAILLLLGRWLWIVVEKARNHPQRSSIVVGFVVLSAYLFHAFFNNFLSTDKFAFLFWGIAAWMISNYEKDDKQPIL
jgi:putative inorganic carbon (hco3(-)) transporter